MIAIYVKPTGADCSVHADWGKPRPMEVTIFTGVKDDTIVEFAFAEAGSAKDWPRVTLGEIRAWLKEKAAAAGRDLTKGETLLAAAADGLIPPVREYTSSPGAKVEAPADLPPTATDAAAPGFTEPTAPAEPTLHGLMDDGLALTGGPEYRAQPREGVTAPVTPVVDDPPSDDRRRFESDAFDDQFNS